MFMVFTATRDLSGGASAEAAHPPLADCTSGILRMTRGVQRLPVICGSIGFEVIEEVGIVVAKTSIVAAFGIPN